MANNQNLIRPEDLTPSERRENASKAGKASAKSRKEKKAIQTILVDFLETPAKKIPQLNAIAEKFGISGKKNIKELYVMLCVLNSIKNANLSDIEKLAHLIGGEANHSTNIVDDDALSESLKSLAKELDKE